MGGTGCCEIWEDLYCQSTYYYTAFSQRWIWSCSLIVTLVVVARLTSEQLVIDQMVTATISLDGAEYLNSYTLQPLENSQSSAGSVEIVMGSSKSSGKEKEGKKTCCSSLHSWYLFSLPCVLRKTGFSLIVIHIIKRHVKEILNLQCGVCRDEQFLL